MRNNLCRKAEVIPKCTEKVMLLSLAVLLWMRGRKNGRIPRTSRCIQMQVFEVFGNSSLQVLQLLLLLLAVVLVVLLLPPPMLHHTPAEAIITSTAMTTIMTTTTATSTRTRPNTQHYKTLQPPSQRGG